MVTTKRAGHQERKQPRARAASSTLSIAVTLPSRAESVGKGVGPTKLTAPMSAAVANELMPEPDAREQALSELRRLGFVVSAEGRLSVSIRGSRSRFERVFGTKLTQFRSASRDAQTESFYFPGDDAPWKPHARLASLIDDAYIQWPHIYLSRLFESSGASPIPPGVNYHHLRATGDLTWLLNVDRVHREGTTGRGVTVAMIDSGFAHAGHPYFQRRGYRTTTVLAPGASERDKDGNSHGTGESANLMAVAPDATFIGVKLDHEGGQRGASVLEGLQQALLHNPKVISISIGYDLRDRIVLPNSLKALEAEIQAAVASGIVVVVASGNGQVAFPGMMPDVISAGGAFVNSDGLVTASDYASGFTSQIYFDRIVPDCCGLVGMKPEADYIALPVQPESKRDVKGATHDGTTRRDGWAIFSGTSAAAPQLAGVCALLLQRNAGLSPADLKSVLQRTALDVTQGRASVDSTATAGGEPARVGIDAATGAGLIDAFEAWRQV